MPAKALAATPRPGDVGRIAGPARREGRPGAVAGDVVEDDLDVRMAAVEGSDDVGEDLERARSSPPPRQQNHLIVIAPGGTVGTGVGPVEGGVKAMAWWPRRSRSVSGQWRGDEGGYARIARTASVSVMRCLVLRTPWCPDRGSRCRPPLDVADGRPPPDADDGGSACPRRRDDAGDGLLIGDVRAFRSRNRPPGRGRLHGRSACSHEAGPGSDGARRRSALGAPLGARIAAIPAPPDRRIPRRTSNGGPERRSGSPRPADRRRRRRLLGRSAG